MNQQCGNRWFNDGTGQTSADTNARHLFPAPGLYEVCMEVCNQNACDTICKWVTVGTTSQAPELDENKMGRLNIFPNPISKGMVTIEYALFSNAQVVNVWNANGIVVVKTETAKRKRWLCFDGHNSIAQWCVFCTNY